MILVPSFHSVVQHLKHMRKCYRQWKSRWKEKTRQSSFDVEKDSKILQVNRHGVPSFILFHATVEARKCVSAVAVERLEGMDDRAECIVVREGI